MVERSVAMMALMATLAALCWLVCCAGMIGFVRERSWSVRLAWLAMVMLLALLGARCALLGARAAQAWANAADANCERRER